MSETSVIPQWDLADRMRKALRNSGIGVQEMADYLDVARNTVSTWINGRIEPSTQTLRLWAIRCDVDYEWLVSGGLRTAPIRCYDPDADLADLCAECWDDVHCDGANPDCCCTCTWDDDWAEEDPALDLCRSDLGLAA